MSIPLLPVSERTFAKTYAMMVAKRKAMDQPCDFRSRLRRTSSIFGIIPIEPLPPVPSVEEPILKPLSITSIDSELEDAEPVPLEPEVCVPVAQVEAGYEEPELEPESEESDEPGDSQDEGEAGL